MEDEHDLRWIYEHVHGGEVVDWNPEVVLNQNDTVDMLGLATWDSISDEFCVMPHPLWIGEQALWQSVLDILKSVRDGTARAVDWSQDPSPETDLWIRAIPRGDYVEVDIVRDDGPGED